MSSFLYSVAKAFYHGNAENLRNHTFVFPSRRAELFFLKHISKLSGKYIFSPSTITIDDFVSQLSGYAPADRVEMLFLLYNHYINATSREESFDDFYYWADILLTDFDDVDNFLVDASKIFSNIYELKEIDAQFKDMLTEEQLQFLQRFINNFNLGKKDDASKKEFITLWQVMNRLYQGLRSDLASRGCAYNGMMLRSIVERILANEITKKDIELRYKKIVFIGFNLLSVAEETMFAQLRDMGVADFYWDYNMPIKDDTFSIMADSMSKNIKNFPSAYKLYETENQKFPDIELVAIPSNVGQTKYAGEIISKIISNASGTEGERKEQETNTVVVLPDEKLLLPMLHTIPSVVGSINITMGYPLSETPLFSLFKSIFDIHTKAKVDEKGQVKHYYQNVLSLLRQPNIKELHGDIVSNFIDKIIKGNIVYVTSSVIPEELKYLFPCLSTNDEKFEYIKTIIDKLCENLSEKDSITCEFLYYYKMIINRLQALVKDFSLQDKTLFKLIEKMSSSIKVPFNGEPLSGLQIMGILETRALDFDNVIILSMNEGCFPADSRGDTFIPYNVRRGFGMSSYEQRDGIAEYYFYRLLSRAKRVYLAYDSRAEGAKVGDLSRFVYQLKYQYPNKINSFVEKNINYSIKLPKTEKIVVEKKDKVLKKLNAYKKGGKRALSASTLNTYINCSLQFYFSSVECIKESDKVLEDVDSSVFGTIYHDVMEKIYEPYIGKTITKDILEELQSKKDEIERLTLEAFAKNYFKTTTIKPLTGRLSLRGEIIKKMVDRTLELDKGRSPFVLLQTELNLNTSITLPTNEEVLLTGKIDRLDLTSDIVNIVDYKSGKVVPEFLDIDDIFIPTVTRKKQVFQLLFYVYLLQISIEEEIAQSGKNKDLKELMNVANIKTLSHGKMFSPGLYAFNKYFSDTFQWKIKKKENARVTEDYIIEPNNPLFVEYVERLEKTLSEIFNKDIPFTQTEEEETCKYCPYANICKR
ncbi:MAG: PD-(D/E)XK nuclease family protein [Bacteroidales bacterium]|nr:PD-(D/E)XK nuclease family protein [Bacteroidales bacterium]